jgi:PAS domain S-box-containing protein
MNWQSSPYVLLLLMAATLSVALAAYAWRRRSAPGVRPFIALLLAAAAWSLAYALELGSAGLPAKLFWIRVQYFSATTAPLAWLAMALQYTGRQRWLTRRNLLWLSLLPGVTLLLVWTNPYHGLVWSRVRIVGDGLLAPVTLERGPWFWIYFVYAYLLMGGGTGLLIHWVFSAPNLYRAQVFMLVLSGLAPWLGNALYVAGLSPFGALDLTPFGFTLAALGVTWALFQYRLMDIVPLARGAVVESMIDGAIVLDPENRVVDLNPAAQGLIRQTPSEVLGKPITDALAAWPESLTAYFQLLDGGADIALPRPIPAPEEGASPRWYDLRISALHDRKGGLTGRLLLLRDVTQRRRVEEALHRSEARHRSLVDGVPIGLYRSTPDGVILEANPAMAEMLGYLDRDALLRASAADLYVDPGDRLRWQMEMEESGLVRGFETELRCRDGSTIWVSDNAQVTRDAAGRVAFYEGSLENITERVHTEEALRQRTRALALLVQVGDELAASLDTQQITGRLLQEVTETIGAVGSSVWLWDREAEGQEEPEWLVCAAAFHIEEGRTPVDRRVPSGRGIVGWVALTGESVIVPDVSLDPRFYVGVDARTGFQTESILAVPLLVRGRTVGVLEVVNKRAGVFNEDDRSLVETLAASAAVAIDNARLVEALRQQAGELQARNEELDAFAHTAAHDLKNPLAKVVGYCELLREDYRRLPQEDLGRYLHLVAQEGRKMGNIIDELLLLAGVRTLGEVEMSPLDMERIVTEVQARLTYVIEASGARISQPESWPVALGYAPWIEEVWINYLSNAIKYGGDPPRIELGATEGPEGMIRFWVRDNGVGLTTYEQEQLFTPFTRLDRLRAKGHGLGLSIVRRIVERLGGEVSVESQVGRGSVFGFTLPGA